MVGDQEAAEVAVVLGVFSENVSYVCCPTYVMMRSGVVRYYDNN